MLKPSPDIGYASVIPLLGIAIPSKKSKGPELDNLYRMFERTNLCPYTDQCESFQTIIRARSWMEQALAGLSRKRYRSSSSHSGYTVQTLQFRLAHLRVVKERCYRYNGRCLRFWQFKAKEGGEPALHRRRTALLLHEYNGEAEIEPIPE